MEQEVYTLERYIGKDNSNLFILRQFSKPGEQPMAVACGSFDAISGYFGFEP